MPSGSLRRQFAAALTRLLRPVVRQMIARGITYPAFDEIVKQVFVDVAERDFPLHFKRQTDSRLALVTGINRKEVAQIRRRGPDSAQLIEVESSIITHVIGRWTARAPYAAKGRAKPLPYEGPSSHAPSFTRLVRDLHIDIPVRSVLDEMLRLKAVELRSDGQVLLKRQAYVPASGEMGKITLLGSDPAELFETIAHNIDHPDAPRLQRKVAYDNIGSDALPAVREMGRKLGEELVRRANTSLASYDRDRAPSAPGGHRARVALGVYYFEEETAASQTPERAAPEPRPPGRIQRRK